MVTRYKASRRFLIPHFPAASQHVSTTQAVRGSPGPNLTALQFVHVALTVSTAVQTNAAAGMGLTLPEQYIDALYIYVLCG